MTAYRVEPWLDDGDLRLYHGDVLAVLRELPSGIAQTCVTSPPYWGLRCYGVDGQLGLEATPTLYIERMVEVFREVRRVLRDDATLWINIGDSYSGNGTLGRKESISTNLEWPCSALRQPPIPMSRHGDGLKPKDLVGIPWRLAFALQADGWYLRSDIIWSKPNPMPESVTDRPTKAHEYVFLFSKRPRYFYDADAVREAHEQPWRSGTPENRSMAKGTDGHDSTFGGWDYDQRVYNPAGRNLRSVWQIATQPYPEAHFATYPEELVRRCIQAGTREGDTVLDPFVGSGTTALVARKHGRYSIGIDLSLDYLELAARRTRQLSLLGGC